MSEASDAKQSLLAYLQVSSHQIGQAGFCTAWICFLGDFYGLYHGKSPLNHHLGNIYNIYIYFDFFQAS